jgi:NADPH2:quinone reductase
MRAIVVARFGGSEVLRPADVPSPVAGAGQALVDVAYANITFVETQVRAGRSPNPAMAPALPLIPGNGVGGVVSAVGDGVGASWLGTRVVTTTGGSGGYAEQVTVATENLIPVPDGLRIADAVALLADGRTAVALTRAAAPVAGETVLVDAAAGGVGTLLVQLCRNAGAHVVAAAGGARKLALTRDLGAAVTADYTQPHWSSTVPDLDLAFDGVGGEIARAVFERVRRGGRMFVFGMASGSFAPITDDAAARHGVTVNRGAPITPAQMTELSQAALAEAAAGRLQPVIGQTFPLERAADAHAAIETRATVGKTLLVVRPDLEPA